MNFKKILIPTELNELSTKATEFAVDLATQAGIPEVILLNIIVPAHSQAFAASGDVFSAQSGTASRLNLMLMEKHQKLVDNEAARFSTDNVTVRPYVRFNDSETDLNEYMRYFDAGLLVCGSRNHETFLDKLFANQTEKIIRHVITEIMCNEYVSFEETAGFFHLSEEEIISALKFEESLFEGFVNDGLLHIENGTNFTVSEIGRFFIRNIAAQFDPNLNRTNQRFSKAL